MERSNETLPDVIELGEVTTETRGAIGDFKDENLRQLVPGLAID
jgi:hypothetical protein